MYCKIDVTLPCSSVGIAQKGPEHLQTHHAFGLGEAMK